MTRAGAYGKHNGMRNEYKVVPMVIALCFGAGLFDTPARASVLFSTIIERA